MKLVIDLQGAQSVSARTEIGQYSFELAKAMARSSGGHEVWIALSGAFADTIDPLREAFATLLPKEHVVVWEAPGPVAENDPMNNWRRRTAEIVREAFLASLKPDMVHVSSLFEGFFDNAVTSVGSFLDNLTTAVTFHDLIFDQNTISANSMEWYQHKLASLRRASVWLTSSESSRDRGIRFLDLPPSKIFNVSVGPDPRFHPIQLDETTIQSLRQRYRLSRPFVMYAGVDYHGGVETLISAYAQLPSAIHRTHQLLIIGPAGEERFAEIKHHARERGLKRHELVLSRVVLDDDLVLLYNLCEAFCVPSSDDGLRRPALDAMQCGAATIGPNQSNIPDLIGCADALFDPYDQRDLSRRLCEVLTDTNFRRRLKDHGLQQARKFSWEECARQAWSCLEAHFEETQKRKQPALYVTNRKRLRLAYVSPLPPQRTGVAVYSSQLVPELARHYEIDVIVDQEHVSDPWICANCSIRDVKWFEKNAWRCDRILYHFGNSLFHKHMFGAVASHPGVISLHDFYLGDLTANLEHHQGWHQFWRTALYRSHGYGVLHEQAQGDENNARIVYKYPTNFSVLENAVGVIVHSSHSKDLAGQFYGDSFGKDWVVIPHLRPLPEMGERESARAALGFRETDFVLCCFGAMGPTKLNQRLLDSWLGSSSPNGNCHLVFVGEKDAGDYGVEFNRTLQESTLPESNRVRVTGFASPALYRQYMSAADIAVQLRTLSHGETSGAVLDCLSYALPTIVNANGSMAELPRDCVLMLPDEFGDVDLAAAIDELRANSALRRALGERGREFVRQKLSPRLVAERYFAAIENSYATSNEALKSEVLASLASLETSVVDEREWMEVARAVNSNMPTPRPQRQLLVDVSSKVATELKTGIERVVRAQLLQLLHFPPEGFRTEPVYLSKIGGRWHYRYARNFTTSLLQLKDFSLADSAVELAVGDVFYCPDYSTHDVADATADGVYAYWRARGISINFLVHDLLPITHPDFFPPWTYQAHARWLDSIVTASDQIICVSQATADTLSHWLTQRGRVGRTPSITIIHHGADISAAPLSSGFPEHGEFVLAKITSKTSFLMVGTVEPRKGHLQALAAFEQLWDEGLDINLIIVGVEGWKNLSEEYRRTIPEIVGKLRNHPERGTRLFWLEDVSDVYLDKLYGSCKCLIAASEDEGFGLPLIEAARHKLSILARDIPVFREVAGKHASYFNGKDPEELIRAIREWLSLYKEGRQPKSDDMPWFTWAQNRDRLLANIVGEIGDSHEIRSEHEIL